MSYNTYPQNPFPPNSEDVGGGGSYTLPIASTTVLGGVKVGSGLAINADGELYTTPNYENNNYNFGNTSPQTEIGNVIDGSGNAYSLYRKCFNTGSFGNSTDITIATGLTDEYVVNGYGFAYGSSDGHSTVIPIPYVGGTSNIFWYYDKTTHDIILDVNGNFTAYTSGKFILEYYIIPTT